MPGQEQQAYEALFRAQAPRIYRMAYLFLHDRHAAEDAAQETYSRGLTGWNGFRGDSTREVWLYAIALNVCRQRARESRVREGLASSRMLDRGRLPGRRFRGPLSSLIRRETAALLTIALGYLTEQQRESFVLHYVEELPYQAIAPMLDVSVVAARGFAHRARKILLSKLPAALESL